MTRDAISEVLELNATQMPAAAGAAYPGGLSEAAARGAGRTAAFADLTARTVSAVGSPPLLISAVLLVTASAVAGEAAWTWAVTEIGVGVVAPLLYLLARSRAGGVSDLDVELREQRLFPQVVMVASLGAAFIAARAGSAPTELTRLALLLFVQAFVVLNVTLRWKISVHSTVAAMAGCVVWVFTGNAAALLIGLPAIMWSRIHLERHTPAQTAAGAALGILLFLPARAFLLGG